MENDNIKMDYWIVIFLLAILIDGGLIIFATIKGYTIILYIMVIFALSGAYFLQNFWNKDERTDKAINNASRVVIKIFSILLSGGGIAFILLSQVYYSVLWEIGVTLVVSAIVLLYLQLILSVMSADSMS